jgi:hypothetical protein
MVTHYPIAALNLNYVSPGNLGLAWAQNTTTGGKIVNI